VPPLRDALGRLGFQASGVRLADSVVPAVQIVVAAVAAYSFTHLVLGHEIPLLALTVTISSLGFVRDARPVRVLESAIGIVTGIAVSEALLLVVGKGIWQLAVVLLVTLLAARLLSDNNAFAVAAGTQSMLVMLLPDPAGGPFVRSLDGLIGGVVALLVTALIPRDPRRIAIRDARRLFAVVGEALGALVVALDRADAAAAERALERLRGTQPLIDDWRASIDSALSITRVSPFLRRHRGAIEQQQRVLIGMDLATRNLRVIARRVQFLVVDGRERPRIAGLVGSLATSVDLLGATVENPLEADTALAGLAAVAGRLDPRLVDPDAPITDSVVVLMVRPLVVDLLTAAGLDGSKARASLPAL
jgi:uncharacterized membrane protein YgaE (UPF0421/DUF939 family)